MSPEDGRDQRRSTQQPAYAARLSALEGARWKQLLNVQLPYQWNLRRLGLGRTLDVGCGIGRNLRSLPVGSLGVDHNEEAVRRARGRDLEACTVAEFHALPVERRSGFDSLLLAHVVEHMTEEDADALLTEYLPCLVPDGRVVLITPQEAGYRTDPTHVRYVDLKAGAALVDGHGLRLEQRTSFPFPRAVGRVFPYNEFILVARRTG